MVSFEASKHTYANITLILEMKVNRSLDEVEETWSVTKGKRFQGFTQKRMMRRFFVNWWMDRPKKDNRHGVDRFFSTYFEPIRGD